MLPCLFVFFWEGSVIKEVCVQRLKLLVLLLVVLLVAAACGSNGGAAQPTTAPADSNAPATAAPAAEPTAPAAEPTAATAAEPTAATGAAPAELQVDKSKLSKELHIYNWADYLDPTVLDDFEAEYGVKVTMEVYDNNEDMIAKIRPGNSGYDVVFPSDYAVEIMWRDKLLAPLDKSLLPNMANNRPSNMDLYYDKGNMYSVPYNYGTTGLAYDKSKFSAPVDSWAAVFDQAQLEANKGYISMLDDEREVPGAALHYLGKSMNDTEAADLKQAEDLLKMQKEYISGYDSSNVSRRLASGEIVAGQIYNNNALQARTGIEGDYSGNDNIVFVIPKEGGTVWQDNACIVADSPNMYTAHVFLNYLMKPEVAAKNTAFNLGVTPNAAAEKLLDPKVQELYKEGFAPDDATLKRLEWIVRNDKTVAFTDLWTAVKGE